MHCSITWFRVFDTSGPHYTVENTSDSPKLIELAPLFVDYRQPLERMIGPRGRENFVGAMEEFMEGPVRYAADYFPNCNEGRTGQEWRNLLLFRPAPLDEPWGLPHILSAIDEAGFVPEELPSLLSLAPISESIWAVFGGRVFVIASVGPKSLITAPDDPTLYGLTLEPPCGRLRATWYGDEDGASGSHSGLITWYLVRRKADD